VTHVTLRQWTDVVRRARLGRTVKAVAMVLATYADSDGTRVHPGLARVAWEAEVNYNTAQQALAKLREVQLIQLVRKSGRKGGRRRDADEYRLILGEDVMEHLDIPTPARAEVEIERIRRAKHGQHKTESHPAPMGAVNDEAHPAPMGADTGTGTEPHPSAQGAEAPTAPIRTGPKTSTAPIGATRPHPAALGPTAHDRDTTTTAHADEDLVTASHPPRVRTADAEDHISPPADLVTRPRCPHGRSARTDRGVPRCPDCRAETTPADTEPTGETTPSASELGPRKCPRHKLPNRAGPGEAPRCSLCRHDPAAEAS
jgi:hypothetical protein